MAGFVAKFGIDTADFSRGLDTLVPTAKKAASKLEATFQNSSERRRRAMRKTARLAKKQAASVNKAWLAMTAAAGIGVGLMSQSMTLAAERSDRVAQSLARTKKEKDDLLAGLGSDLSLLNNGTDSWISKLDSMRTKAADWLGGIFSSKEHIAEINKVIAAEIQLTQEIKHQAEMEEMRLGHLAAQGDQIAANRLELIRFQKQLNGSGKTRQQQGEALDLFKQGQRTNLGDAKSFRNRMNQLGLGVMGARAKTPAQQIAMAQAQAQENERLQVAEIESNTKYSPEEQLQLIEETKWAIAERLKLRIKEIKDTEAAQAKADKRSLAALVQSNAIQMLKIKGQDKLAEAMEIEKNTIEQIRDIQEGGGSDQDKIAAIESLKKLGIAQLNGLTKKDGDASTIDAGFFGDSTTRAQIFGPGGGGTTGDSPVVNAVNKSIGVLERIETFLAEIAEQGPRPIVS